MGKEQIVMYFGTNGKPGHYITLLSGAMNTQDQCRIGREIDGDNDLYSAMKKCKGIGYAYYCGVSILCIPYSLDDSRGGSKSIFIVEGRLDSHDMLAELRKYKWVENVFLKLKEKHNLGDITEIKLS